MILVLVLITWIANSEEDLSGYKVYYGAKPGMYAYVVDVGNTTQWQRDLASGTWHFAVTAYDFAGNESGFSEEVSMTIPQDSLPAPVNVKATEDEGAIRVTCDSVAGAAKYYFYAGRQAGVYGNKLSRSDPEHIWNSSLYSPEFVWHFAVSAADANDVEGPLSEDFQYVPAQEDPRVPIAPGFTFTAIQSDTLTISETSNRIQGTLSQANQYADFTEMPEGSLDRLMIEYSLDGATWTTHIVNWTGEFPVLSMSKGLWKIRFRTSAGGGFSEPSPMKYIDVQVFEAKIFTREINIQVSH